MYYLTIQEKLLLQLSLSLVDISVALLIKFLVSISATRVQHNTDNTEYKKLILSVVDEHHDHTGKDFRK
jgi:hypothetical protein